MQDLVMEPIVYVLCAATSLACAFMLYRGYRRRPSQLLFWAAVCFAGLAINNILLVVDLVILVRGPDLSVLRNSVTLGSLTLLLYGLVWDVV